MEKEIQVEDSGRTFDIGPKSWTEAMGILEFAILDGNRQGRQMAVDQVRSMAKTADLAGEAITIMKELKAQGHTSEAMEAFLTKTAAQ